MRASVNNRKSLLLRAPQLQRLLEQLFDTVPSSRIVVRENLRERESVQLQSLCEQRCAIYVRLVPEDALIKLHVVEFLAPEAATYALGSC